MNAPAPVTVTIRRVNPRIVNGATRAAIDAFADEMLRQERQRRTDAAIMFETTTEGRIYPVGPVNIHE